MPTLPSNPAKAQIGLGTLIAIGPVASATGGTPTYVTIGQVEDVKFSGASGTEISFKTLDYPAVQKIRGIVDQGTVDISFVRAPGTSDAGQVAAKAAFDDGTGQPYKFQVTLFVGEGQTTSGDVQTFNAIITKFNAIDDISPEKVIEGAMTLSITSVPVITAGT
jgi:hypothetical protein